MKFKRNFKKLMAVICIMALTVTSITFSNSQTTKANGSATVNGRTYTVTDGPQGDWTGITCQGIFDNARIHFAWGRPVQPDTITVHVAGEPVAVDNTNEYGCSITLADVDTAIAEAGHQGLPVIDRINIDAFTDEETPEIIFWKAELNVTEAAETTTRDPSVFEWKDIAGIDNLKYDDRTTTKVVSFQQPGWPNLDKPGVYVEQPAGAGAPTEVTINGTSTAINAGDGDYGSFYAMGAGLLFYEDTFSSETTNIEISYAPDVDATLVIKNTDAQEVTTAEETTEEVTTAEETTEEVTTEENTTEEVTTEEDTTEEVTTEEITTEEVTTEEITTEEPTTKPSYNYDEMVSGDTNLALNGTGKDTGKHREGSVGSLNDGIIDDWDNRDGITVDDQSPAGSFDIVLDKEYAASSIDQVVVWWRTADANFYPASGYKVQFGYKGVFTTVATVTSADYPTEGTSAAWDGTGRFVTDTDFTYARAEGNVDTVRILVETPVNYGAQVREIGVFASDPQEPESLPQADAPEGITASSPDYGKIAYTITAGEDQDDYSYNVYDGETLIGENVEAGTEYVVSGVTPGMHTLKVVSIVPGYEASEPVYSDEIEVKNVVDLFGSTLNISTLATVTSVSSFYNDDYTLEKASVAIDGNPKAGEGSNVCIRTGANTNAEIVIELDQDYYVKGLKKVLLAYTNPRTYAANTKISVSADGENYTELTSASGFIPAKDGAIDVNPIDLPASESTDTFKYVKVSLSGGVRDWGYVVNEIAIIYDFSNDIPAVEGLINVPGVEGAISYEFAWAANADAVGYNVYIDGIYVAQVTDSRVDLEAALKNAGSGEHTITIKAVAEDGSESVNAASVEFNVPEPTTEERTTEEATTEEATTEEATTEEATTEEVTTEEVTTEEATTEEVTTEEVTTEEASTEEVTTAEVTTEEATTEEVTTEEATTEEVTTEEATTEEVTTEAPTDVPYDPGFDPSELDYTDVTSGDSTIGYAVADEVIGLTFAYLDAGQSLLAMFSADLGKATSITVNGETDSPVISESTPGLVKVNPTLMADNAYTVIEATFEGGQTLTFVVKRGEPAPSGDTTEATTEEVTTEEATTEEVTTEEITTEEVTTEEVTTEEVTTEAPTQAPGTITDLDISIAAQEEKDPTQKVGGYDIYAGSWNNSTAVAGVDPEDADHIKIAAKSSNWSDAWGLQVQKNIAGLDPKTAYTYEIAIKSDNNDGKVKITGSNAEIPVTGAAQTLAGTVETDEDGNAMVAIGMGWVGLNNGIEVYSVTLKDADGNIVYPGGDEPTTEAPTGDTTEAPTGDTTEAPTQVTTQAPTGDTTVAPTDATTAAPATTAKKIAKPGKTKIKKVFKKKKSAKKLKIKVKKAKGANGYQVAVFKTKKNAKKNKAFFKKYFKKNKATFTITHKKLKKIKKTFYVKVRAYNKDANGKVQYSSWTKAKKAKVK